jgi:hypothetical protein
MATLSRMFHAAPVASPVPGFVSRFEARLAYRQEQRRQGMIWLLLGIGVIALVILALPSLIGVVGLAGRILLPYQIVAYVQGLFNWTYVVLNALLDAVGVLIRHFITTPAGLACIGSLVVAGALIVVWTRFLIHRMNTQSTR